MIYGIGTDLVEVIRIEKIINKWQGKFVGRFFADGEAAYCQKHAEAAIHFGARFAAKEAFLKALGIGLGMGIKLREIEVIHDKNGKPELALTGQALVEIAKRGIKNAHISLSHTKDYATAVVVLEK